MDLLHVQNRDLQSHIFSFQSSEAGFSPVDLSGKFAAVAGKELIIRPDILKNHFTFGARSR